MKVFDFTNVKNSKIAHNLYKNRVRSFSGRIGSSTFLRPRNIWKIFKMMVWTNVLSGVLIVGVFGLFTLIRSILIDNDSMYLFTWLPFGLTELSKFLTWIWSISGLWTLLVTINHWNDVVNLLTTMGTDFSSISAALCSYWYVTNLSIGTEFFSVLLTHPKDLLDTRAIYELILMVDNVGQVSNLFYNSVSAYLPTFITSVLDVGRTWVAWGWSNMVLHIGHAISTSWIYLVSGIANAITPQVPVIIQPVVTSIFHGVATSIGISLVLWFIRSIFGFPF